MLIRARARDSRAAAVDSVIAVDATGASDATAATVPIVAVARVSTRL
jgi:hypothetical protein